ncbi:MAG: type II toxin-antitoxin system HicA family toxin [Bacteroidia bacterium]
MSQLEKLNERLKSNPRDFTWTELVKLLRKLGYTEMKTGKTGGSRRRFVNQEDDIIMLHKPHPSSLLKMYQINDIAEKLIKQGKI